ncbi:MAG: hypothetical protein JNL08_06725 [Planctomycetes bacterium]|nr:hypothetical protein [Planctomycetota bacterium]
MASSPTETASAVGFALQELAACWQQALAALARGDVDHVTALMAIAGDHVAVAGDGSDDTPAEATLRQQAQDAFTQLRAGIETGLAGLADELARSRQGARMLRGYAAIGGTPNPLLDRDL